MIAVELNRRECVLIEPTEQCSRVPFTRMLYTAIISGRRVQKLPANTSNNSFLVSLKDSSFRAHPAFETHMMLQRHGIDTGGSGSVAGIKPCPCIRVGCPDVFQCPATSIGNPEAPVLVVPCKIHPCGIYRRGG